MKIAIDRDIITDQMNALGLSERAIVNQTGMSHVGFRTARQEGLIEGSASIRQVHLLAQALGRTISELLCDPTTDITSTPPPQTEKDVSDLIPMLVELTKPVSVDHIARTLDWDRTRLNTVLAAIPDALQGTGLRLYELEGRVMIIARPISGKIRQSFARIRTSRNDITVLEAQILTRVANGEHVLDRKPSNAVQVAVGGLKNLGSIALNDQAIFAPTDDLRLALPDL